MSIVTGIIISILVFVASEFFLPSIFPPTQSEKRQRHFYSTILTAFSLIMTFTLTTSFEIHKKITAVEKVFTSIVGSHIQQHFQNIFSKYHEHFKQASRLSLLEPWINEAIVSLSKDMDQMSVSLPSSIAKDKVFELYKLANDYIVTTHVGSLDRYDDQRYKEADRNASRRGIPIIRFYLFDGEMDTIEDPNQRNQLQKVYIQDGVTLDGFNEEVKKLHQDMGTLLSVVIPPDKLRARMRREILMVDGELFAETMFNVGTVRATGEAVAISKTQEFLRRLLGTTVPEEYVHYLNAAEVHNRFPHYPHVYRSRDATSGPDPEPLAKTFASRLLRSNK